MNLLLTLVALSLPLLYWWRFKDAALDRDYGPYCYPGLFNKGYFSNGHRDVKPPLIHWGYWVWLRATTWLKLSMRAKLRLFPAMVISLIVGSIGLNSASSAMILGIILISPSIWPHMANTEWLTVSLLGLATLLAPSYPAMTLIVLGLLPLVNQKNLLLIPLIVWALSQKLSGNLILLSCLFLPSFLFAAWAYLTGKWRLIILYLWSIPRDMGKRRTLRANTLQQFHLLMPFLFKFALVLTICDWKSPWFIMLLGVIALTISSKQIVPHHFILWCLPLAMCAQPTPLFFIAWAILWVIQDWPVWNRPELLYPITFRFRQGGHYGLLLDEGLEVVDWIKANTLPDETILINGFENQIYIEAERKGVCMDICEAPREAEKIMPRVIVHCANSAVELDYTGYEPQLVTAPAGMYTVTVRKGLKL